MRAVKMVAVILGLLAVASPAIAGPGGRGVASAEYTLELIPTQNAPTGAQGTMTIKLVDDQSIIHLRVRGLYPNTIYTIWTVFNRLVAPSLWPVHGPEVPACSASGPDPRKAGCAGWTGQPGFPPEGNGVSPTARLGAGFTSGMGMDPGASFVTNKNGDGEIQVKADFDIVNEAPVSNRDIIVQKVKVACLPGDSCTGVVERSLRVTTTWLRKYVADIIAAGLDPARECANYDARFDRGSGGYDPEVANGADARLWQCIDPATADRTGNGLPRVYRYPFDHFRLANHPDDLTHGFIGGNAIDHWIDMVGRRCDLVPPVGPACGP